MIVQLLFNSIITVNLSNLENGIWVSFMIVQFTSSRVLWFIFMENTSDLEVGTGYLWLNVSYIAEQEVI